MSTGEVPFTANAAISVLLAHVSDPPRPPRLLNPGVDRRLEAIIMKALEKEPSLRHQSARELRADLRRIVFAASTSSSQRKAVGKSEYPRISREETDEDNEPTLEQKKPPPTPEDDEPTLEYRRPAPMPPRAEADPVSAPVERTLEQNGPQPSLEDLAQQNPDLAPVRHPPTDRSPPAEPGPIEGTTTAFEAPQQPLLVDRAPPKTEPPPPPITDPQVGFADLLTAVTAAIARTTYYERAHPEFARSLGQLEGAIQKPLKGRSELSFARRDGHTSDLAVMTGAGESMELVKAVPGGIGVSCAQRLGDVFARRGLVALTFKEGADERELADAVELLSGPECSSKELQGHFTLRGLTKVSILFASEMLGRERRLPWQVMLAISRIARDVASIPKIVRDADPEKKSRLRTALISDVTRALRTPEQVRLLLTSWDLIAAELGDGAELLRAEVPQALVASLAHRMLLRVAGLLLSEMEALASAEAPAGGIVPAPPAIVRELMVVIGNRFIKERTIESDEVLRELHTRAVLSFPELPEDLQLWILAEQEAEVIAKDPEQVLRVLDSIYDLPRYAREAATLSRAIRVLARRGEVAPLFTVVVRLQQRHARGSEAGDETREAIAAKTLANLADTEVLVSVARVLLSGRGALRDPAQGILASFGEVGARALCQVRAEGNDVVRIRFVDAIKEIGRPALPALFEKLDGMRPGDDPALAEDILRALPEFEDEKTGGIVSKLLQHRAASVRRAAANALAGPWGPLARVALLSALDDSDDRVRVAALTGLRKVTPIDLEIVRRVERILAAPGMASDNVYAVGASLLGEAVADAREEAISALCTAIQARPRGVVARLTGGPTATFESPFVVETLARALIQIGGERGRDAVRKRAEKSRGPLKTKLSALLAGD
jgi:HEAT repeat protein